MRKTLTILVASMALIFAAHAEDAHHSEQKTDAAVAKPVVQPSGEAIKKMQDNVKKMRSQLDRISKAKTDEERQKLIAEHMQTIRENMMAAKGMMGEGMACAMGNDGKGGMAGMGMMQTMMGHMQMMRKDMDMMRMMMGRMMQNQSGDATMPMEK